MLPFSMQHALNESEAIEAALSGGRYIAGGTTLIDLMREEVERPERLIDINAVPLDYIREDEGDLIIGALARMSDVAADHVVRRLQPLIAETLVEGASPQLRNMASIGGNLLQRVRCPYFRMLDAPCNKRVPDSGCAAIDGLNAGHAILGGSAHCVATHPSDLAVSLVALEATMRVRGSDGERSFPVEALYRLPGTTPHLEHMLVPGELIIDIRVPGGNHARHARYLKVRDRASYEFALVSTAAALDIVEGVIHDARIACGGVGTKPWRMRACEQVLAGKKPGRTVFEAAGRMAKDGTVPLSGNRYKVGLLERTVIRALEMASEVQS
ncbi:FAD binding domain-containing protein [Pararobbsia alpina]|uniref:Aldehyde oxidoreductase FAD-binding subunit PaoB n=1 Tax=Pararobbsia alpina TaxID=621374 RepID=A0A6S7BD15_9BURK|nr:xanthine dehydrogenase family protein subunit M [Pararobbsia alpina]CAB3795272.1 Aldehyde oxidoreductase FAD-binding subunit PaoB [Pararobbsia alpina]